MKLCQNNVITLSTTGFIIWFNSFIFYEYQAGCFLRLCYLAQYRLMDVINSSLLLIKNEISVKFTLKYWPWMARLINLHTRQIVGMYVHDIRVAISNQQIVPNIQIIYKKLNLYEPWYVNIRFKIKRLLSSFSNESSNGSRYHEFYTNAMVSGRNYWD